MSDGLSDETLMTQVREGRREPLEPLVQRHSKPLYALLCRLIGRRDLADDVFQETFLRVWLKRHTYIPPRSFRAWLYAIAVNCVRLSFRRRPEHVSLPDDVCDDRPQPEAGVAERETAADIRAAINRLPTSQRAIVAMRVWDEMSYAQIAEILGKTEGNVRALMCHALNTLRATLNRAEN